MNWKHLLFGLALVLLAVAAAIVVPRISVGADELVVSPDTVVIHRIPGTGVEINDTRVEGVAQPPAQAPRVLISVAPPAQDGSGICTYTYTLEVLGNSQLDVGSFTLEGLAPNCFQSGPTGWKSLTEWRGPGGLRWYARLTEQETVLSPYRIRPGESRSFVLKSYGAPETVTFACEGEVASVVHASEAAAAAAHEARGGDNASPFLNAVTGTTIGPVGSNVSPCGGGGGGDDDPIIRPPHGATSVDSLIELGFPQPNPRREGRQTILFRLRVSGSLRVVVYDVAGRRVAEPLNEDLGPGTHSLVWNGATDGGSALPAGTYYYQFYLNGRAMGARGTVLLR